MREFASLIPALAASVALHIGGATLVEAGRGGAAPGPARSAATGRPPLLHIHLLGTTPWPATPRPAASAPSGDPAHPAGHGPIVLPLPRYFPPNELDRKPEAVGEVPLAYPADMPLVARSRVVLSLLIDERGEVDEVIVEAAEAPTELEQLASRAFAAARFSPGMRDGVAVKSWLRVEVTFESE